MAGRLPSLLRYFNPLAPRGARRTSWLVILGAVVISIH